MCRLHSELLQYTPPGGMSKPRHGNLIMRSLFYHMGQDVQSPENNKHMHVWFVCELWVQFGMCLKLAHYLKSYLLYEWLQLPLQPAGGRHFGFGLFLDCCVQIFASSLGCTFVTEFFALDSLNFASDRCLVIVADMFGCCWTADSLVGDCKMMIQCYMWTTGWSFLLCLVTGLILLGFWFAIVQDSHKMTWVWCLYSWLIHSANSPEAFLVAVAFALSFCPVIDSCLPECCLLTLQVFDYCWGTIALSLG